MLTEFWNRVSQILLLAAPIVLLLFGVDILPIADGLGEIFTIYIPGIVVIAKDIWQIIQGWRAASQDGRSFIQYTGMEAATIYKLRTDQKRAA